MRRLHAALWVALLLWGAIGQSQSVPAPQSQSVGLMQLDEVGPMDGPETSDTPVAPLIEAGPLPAVLPYPFYPLAGNLWQDIDIGNFVDLDPTTGILDYRCSDYTYDGHRGHDSGIFGFRQQEIGVPIFAVLDGTVTARRDGEFDMQTSMSDAPANFVELDHGGGHRTLYLHMKKNSVAVTLGQQVTAGTQLGLTGSSGSSTGPHLHFESRLNGVAFEPSAGGCGGVAPGLWSQQPEPPASPTVDEVVLSLSPFTGNAGYPFDTAVRARGVSTGFTTAYWRIRFGHAPPNSRWRFQLLRPNNSLPVDGSGTFTNARTARGWSASFFATMTFDVAGTWRMRFLLNDAVVADAPFTVFPAGTSLANRPPEPISAVLEPAVPRVVDVPFCRVQSTLPVYRRDPDNDIMRYRYQWTVNNQLVRDVTTAAMADALRKGILTQGAHVSCSITPMDGLTSGSTATVSTIVGQGLPTMTLDKATLGVAGVTTGASFSARTSAQAVRLTQSGAGTVTWTATASAPWLAVSPASGSGSATLNISPQFASGLAASQTASVMVAFTGAANSSASIAVTLTVVNAQTAAAPSGAFDTPLNGSTGVVGSIAVTGWAMDDVEVTAVRILRDPVAGEPAGQLVFIGNATLVEGARPDVAGLFPTSPRNTRAGWGYLMLTNFLPNLGNGTFRLTAIADDADGHATVLGTKTITCSNSSATAPFGAIDTPGQGGVVNGIVNNFGWVLSRNPRRADPPGGGTVRVVIDGAVIGTVPTGWTSRSDLSAFFPLTQYAGIVSALAVAAFDSTTLTNGVHTIAWSVIDNNGEAAGIGSRYFTVSNGSALRLAPPRTSSFRFPSRGSEPITGRRGPDLDAPLLPLPRNAEGVLNLAAEELDRIELRVRATRGYLRSAIGDLPLPIGSRLDPVDGGFTWLAGPGFIGAYDLVFETSRGIETVRVTIYPQGMFTRPHVIIDGPSPGEEVSDSFTVAGWALHPDTRHGTGIDAIHVWAYPAGGGLPIFLGATTPNGRRPDVADVYGSRGLETGYAVTVNSLPRGTYTLAVFGWSAMGSEFLPATTRLVIVR